uniref:Uncharacterized protein n=1 Tax=Gossypium raimondii TaxID=29730 RepID=A0A0D2QV06_GOSRA|nr:hypothetical protein B456_004G099700 [Gossypium raimondii]
MAHKSTSIVIRSKIKMLTTKFENLIMEENETIGILYVKSYTNAKLARNVLFSLLDKFNIKATAIEEDKDINTMHIDELIGSLQTVECNLD